MQIEPPESAFAKRYARGEAQIVWTTLVSDLETPVSAFLKLAGDRSTSFLLESVEGGEARGRYSIIGLSPDLVWRSVDGRAEIRRNGEPGFAPCRQMGLSGLRELIAESRIELPETLPPMAAGIFGYLGYEMVRLMFGVRIALLTSAILLLMAAAAILATPLGGLIGAARQLGLQLMTGRHR